MKKLLCITGSLLISAGVISQLPVGSWSDHLRYNTAKNIAAGPDEIFASTGSSIIVYNKAFGELKKLSTVTGLSETGISTIAWSTENEVLIIAYNSTNIDLLINNTVYNIPDILNKYIPGIKKINTITTSGKYAYLSASFGIVVIDLLKREIHDTWKPGPGPEPNEVFDLTFWNNKVYAATSIGIWHADALSQGLAYFGNWAQIPGLPDPDSRYTLILSAGKSLFVNMSSKNSAGDSVFKIEGGTDLISYIPGVFNRSFDEAPGGFTVSSNSGLSYFNSDGSLKSTISSYGWGNPDIKQAAGVNNDIWLADSNYGLIKGENMQNFIVMSLTGPSTNSVSNIKYGGGKIIICGGGINDSWTGLGAPIQIAVYENYSFTNINSGSLNDAVRSWIDPDNSNHFFVSTWGDGLLEYDKGTLVKHFDGSNTPQLAINSGNNGIRIFGLAMDRQKNLWITQTGITGSIKILKPDGSWIVNPLTIDAPVLGDIISTSGGQKWIILPGGHGLFIIDDNNTPSSFSDDRYKQMVITDTDDKVITNVFSAAEDRDGNIWIGTDQGPVIYYNPGRVLDGESNADRVKIPRNDGSGLADYMLGTETITSISVDGANRKWLGTKNSGVYLLSADGTTILKNYNTRNSPIFSDSVISVAVDNKTGEVWFGTALGTISVREISTEGGQGFRNVYAFPNPVRTDYNGNVTITGLMRDTQVKITDISGNLVNEVMSAGGQAEWDLTTYNGKRVTTGVYLAFCSSADGSESSAIKILVIGK